MSAVTRPTERHAATTIALAAGAGPACQPGDRALAAMLRRLEVPVYMVTGAHEVRGRAVPAEAWFDRLEAQA